MADKLPSIDEFMDNTKDFGLVPLSEPMSDADRKVASMLMATNAALMQLILEGVMPPAEQLHFMIHLQEFANRIYKGEAVKLPTVAQTLAVDSIGGKMFLGSANVALTDGVNNANRIREALKDANAQYEKQVSRLTDNDEQTNKEVKDVKPTLH